MSEPLIDVVLIYVVFALATTAVCRWVLKSSRLVLAIVLLSPFLLYVPVEVRTALYGAEFRGMRPNRMFNVPVVYFRVFSRSDDEATLFCVEGDNGRHEMGNMYRLQKRQGRWVVTKWLRTYWTNLGGSASEFTVPPHF